MPVHIIFEKSDGSIVKGLRDCTIPSPATKELVDSDLNHGVIRPGQTTTPQIIAIRTFSWNTNGLPGNPITDCGLFLSEYYTTSPTYSPDSGKTFCGGASSSTFGGYSDANGSHSAAGDLAALQSFGDLDTGGVEVSVDLGRNYTKFTSTLGILSNPIALAATAMDIGSVNGQLNPGDVARIFTRIQIPSTFNSASQAGVYLFNLGLFYNYTE